jgi:hypothetical protein
MATEAQQVPINGAFVHQPQQSYATTEQNLAVHNANTANSTSVAQPSTSTPSNTATTEHDLSKEEVGWYFVERYYTTLSKNADKLFVRSCAALILLRAVLTGH